MHLILKQVDNRQEDIPQLGFFFLIWKKNKLTRGVFIILLNSENCVSLLIFFAPIKSNFIIFQVFLFDFIS